MCTVVQGLMNPSLWEMRTYCTSDQLAACPLYQQHAVTQELGRRARLGVASLNRRVPSSSLGRPTFSPRDLTAKSRRQATRPIEIVRILSALRPGLGADKSLGQLLRALAGANQVSDQLAGSVTGHH